MKKESKKLMALLMSMTLGLAATVTNVTYAAPTTIQATEDEDLHNESVTNEAVKIEAIGLEASYATGEAICFTVKVTNTSDQPVYVQNYNGKKGNNGSISVSIKTKDGKYCFGENYNGLVSDGAKFSGMLESGESIERDYTFYLRDFSLWPNESGSESLKDYEGEFQLNVSFVYATMTGDVVAVYDVPITKSFDFEVSSNTESLNIPEWILRGDWGEESPYPPVARKMKMGNGLMFWISGLKKEYNSDEQVYPAVCVKNISDNVITIFSDYSDENGYIICEIISEDNTIKFEENLNKPENTSGKRYTKDLKPGECITALFSTSIENAKTGKYAMTVGLNSLSSENDTETAVVFIPIKINNIKDQNDNKNPDNQNKFKGKLYGDFDLDGKVTLKDAKRALRFSLGIDSVTEDELSLGNLNGKGVTLNEAKSFLRMSLGIEQVKQI